MTAALLAIAIAFGVGRAAVFAARPGAWNRETAGEAWLLGIAICAGSLFTITLAGIPWSLRAALLLTAIAVILLVITGFRRRRATAQISSESAAPDAAVRVRGGWASWLFDLLTAVTIAGYTAIATAGPIAEIDFIAAWGLKARMFWIARGIDWPFLENPWYRWIHADYPPLVPLAFDWMILFQGQWDDRWLGALYPCFALALLLIIRSLLDEELGSPAYAAFATLALTPLAASPWIGIGEGPLLAFGTAGVLLLRRAIRDSAHSVEYASLFLGVAAATKNEGLALLAAAAIAMLASRRSRAAAWRLWPAAAIAAPWLIARALHALSTDLARGEPLQRIIEHAQHPLILIHAIAGQSTGHRWFWIGVAVAFTLTIGRLLREERFVLVTVGLLLAFDLIAYLSTAQDVEWLVRWSWERLLAQVTVLAGFLAVVAVSAACSRPGGEANPRPL
jgi:hypothetical protein